MSLSKEEKRIYYEGARKAVEAVYGEQEWVSEASFAHPDGFGGKVELHAKCGIVVDFKTKEFGPDDQEGLKTWDNHHMQIAAYVLGLTWQLDLHPNARGAICYVSVTHPGLAVCIPITDDALDRGLVMLLALLSYWKAKNKYESAFELDPAA